MQGRSEAAHRRRDLTWRDAAFLVLSPVVAWATLGINLINQDGYLDPWYYTGYGQIFERLVEVHGWPYKALRFPVVFLNSVCCSGDAPILGYGLLRYGLLLLAGVPLYLLASRHFGRPVGICAFLFLFCNPLFLRILLWDLTPFVSIPTALAGIAVWMLAEEHRLLGRFCAGALFAISINAHVFTATAIGCFLVVEIVFALGRARNLRRLAQDLAGAALGAGLVVALGVLYYRSRIGEFDPFLLLSTNLTAMKWGNTYATSHARPFLSWAATATYVYVPLILLGGITALRRAQPPRSSVEDRILWFLAAYCGFYAIYRFVLGNFVLEEFYYFGHLTLAVYLAVPLVVGLLARRGGSAVSVGVAFALGLVLPILALRVAFRRATVFLELAYGALSVMAVFWGLSVLLAILLGMRRFPPRRVWVAASLMAVFIQFTTLVEREHRHVFDARVIARERGVYITGVEYSRFVDQYDGRDHRVLVWYPREAASLWSVSFTTLGDALNEPFAGPGMPTIGKKERKRLREPKLRYVMLLAEDPRDITRGKAALDEVGIAVRLVEARRLGDAGYSAMAVLLEIIRPAAPAGY